MAKMYTMDPVVKSEGRTVSRKFMVFVSIIVIFILLNYFGYSKKNGSLNIEIPENIITAKQLLDFSQPYVIKYLGKDAIYSIGEVRMKINSKHKGDVKITFVVHKPSRKVKVFQLHIDTNKRTLIGIEELGSSEKVNPGSISITDWRIDSIEAVERAKLTLETNTESQVKFYVTAYQNYNVQKEYWRVQLQGKWVDIDPLSGDVIAKST